MNILHQLFHTIWWSHHETHHLPEKELSVFNAFYFDVPDLIGENLIGPLLFCLIKVLFGGSSCSIHYASFFLSVVCDQIVHSLNPYTITFWNPLLDNFLRSTCPTICTTRAKLDIIPFGRCIKFKVLVDQIIKAKLGIHFPLTLTITTKHLIRISLETFNYAATNVNEDN